MKIQTFIAILKDENNRTVNFERFSCKRLETVIKKMRQLYLNNQNLAAWLYKQELDKTTKIVIHQTDYETSAQNQVWEISKQNFLEMGTI